MTTHEESELAAVLERTISSKVDEIKQAQLYIDQRKKHSFSQFLYLCVKILASQNYPGISRFQAGLQAKNAIVTKDDTRQQEILKQWKNDLPEDMKTEIKKLILESLGTESINGVYKRPSASAQLIAAIAGLELPDQKWPELLKSLSNTVTGNNSTVAPTVKEACLEAIGYICQDVDSSHVMTYTSDVLTAIVHGMKTGTTNHIKLAATNAMLNSLEFISDNFEKQNERDYIMQTVCEATQAKDTKIQTCALQCLVKIVSLYYDHMEPYMSRALFCITMESMKNKDDGVCLQGIEFWSNVCDEEYDLYLDAQEAWERNQPPERHSKYYAKGALQYLTPILCKTLARQEEADCEDDWNPSKASGVCLMLSAQVTEDDILDIVLPFIEANISNTDWKFRDAAVVSLGSILDGPTPSKLQQLLKPAMATLIGLFDDESIAVRDSTAWCIGKICEVVPELVLNDNSSTGQVFKLLLEKLVQSLEMPPRVSSNVCWALSSLVESCYKKAPISDDTETVERYELSPYFSSIIQQLLKTTNRSDGNESNLRSAAYECIMVMIKNSPDDCYDCVISTTEEIMKRINQLLNIKDGSMSSNEKTQYADLQSLLCATLQSVLRKIKPEHITSMANQVMQALLTMLHGSQQKVSSDENINYGGVHEDALLAVGTLAEVTKARFSIYMEAFMPFLQQALTNYEEEAVCNAAVGVIGYIAAGLGRGLSQYVETIMQMLLTALNAPELEHTIRPSILGLFGDVALAIGSGFVRYLPTVMNSLIQAGNINIDRQDVDQIDYLNDIYESIMTALTGILHGLKNNDVGKMDTTSIFEMVQYLEFICKLIKQISTDSEKTETVIDHTCGLIGDIITILVTESDCKDSEKSINIAVGLFQYLNDDNIKKMLQEGRAGKNQKIKQVALWALREMKKLRTILENNNKAPLNNAVMYNRSEITK